MGVLAGCAGFSEFKVRNCLETSIKTDGEIILSDLLVHHYPYYEHELPKDKLAQLNQCHDSARLGLTE